jgi:hypothetical protein
MNKKDFDYKYAAERMKYFFDKFPPHVTIFTVNRQVAKSGMSAIIHAFVIKDNCFEATKISIEEEKQKGD